MKQQRPGVAILISSRVYSVVIFPEMEEDLHNDKRINSPRNISLNSYTCNNRASKCIKHK